MPVLCECMKDDCEGARSLCAIVLTLILVSVGQTLCIIGNQLYIYFSARRVSVCYCYSVDSCVSFAD